MEYNTDNNKIETQRLILRSFKKEDLDEFYNYAKIEGVGEEAGWIHHKNIEESEQILNRFLKEKNNYAIELKETGKLVGSFGVGSESCIDESSEWYNLKHTTIGYVIAKEYWGNGYATESLQNFIRYCFENNIYDIIFVSHYNHNLKSKRVIEKSGFVYFKDSIRKTRYGVEYLSKDYYIKKF
ncbi:MAG: GNAT family N-acetyltransferase [Defluviitaleaceae bacterium]|nr:GNAT family N-acetyltransferase [Defluviitaleaceae bacterium]